MSLAGIVSAQEDTTKAKELSELVVTGQYRPQSVKNSVYQVRTITKDRIQKQGATKLQDVLSNELNMRFTQDGATGGSAMTMLGLPGQNVKILVDGLPLNGRQGANNQVDINQIDVNTIERIEIVEGPLSVVYGADALAGVINIITKKSDHATWSVTARAQEETIGKEYGLKQGIHNQYGGLSWHNKRWEVGGGIGYYCFSGWKDTAIDRELVWHYKDQITANGFIGYNTGRFNIRYRIDGLDEIIYNPGNFTVYQSEADDSLAFDQEYLSHRVMQQLQSSYFVNGNLSLQGQAAYSTYTRQVFSTQLAQKTGITSLNPDPESQSFVRFNEFSFRGTALYRISPMVSLQPGVDINMESGKGERLKDGTNRINDYAFFVSSEIKPAAWVNIRPGVRIISNSVYNAPPVVPSLNTKFVLSKHLDLRLAYAHGFRAPSLRELYFNFIDANHTIIGNPDLKAETSNSITGSLTWMQPRSAQTAVSVAINGFYNATHNLIDYVFSASNPNVATLGNTVRFKSLGGTVSGTLIHQQLSATVGAGYTGRYNQYSETDKDLPEFKWSPEANARVSYAFPAIGMTANLFYKFTGKLPQYKLLTENGQDVVKLSETGSYNWADFTLTKKLLRYLTINAGIKNIFNVDFVRSSVVGSGAHESDSGANFIGYGRSYFAGITFNWNKK